MLEKSANMSGKPMQSICKNPVKPILGLVHQRDNLGRGIVDEDLNAFCLSAVIALICPFPHEEKFESICRLNSIFLPDLVWRELVLPRCRVGAERKTRRSVV
jgi:hypothetical protein